ncbi:MAG: IS1182 family transposase [Puia sp.]|nr:IS1182 family transposase [Puia sp.]
MQKITVWTLYLGGGTMLGKDEEKQSQFMFVNLDEYVPQDHLLRTIKRTIDFSFIYDKVKDLYSPVGRRSVDPVLLVKMLLVGYWYGIPSERKLEQEVKLNLAYRWFLGLDLAESVPDHSTISQNRRRRFKNSPLFQEIFDTIVSRCVAEGLVTGEVIVTDSTHIKASASRQRVEKIWVEKTPTEYMQTLEQEAQRLEAELQSRRDAAGKKKCGKKRQTKEGKVMNEVLMSKTDPDAGYMNRPGKPVGFHYLGHTSIDPKRGIITDIHVTAGNVNDHTPFVERVKALKSRLGLPIKAIGADKGYDRSEVHYGLEQEQITGYVTPSELSEAEAVIEADFLYDKETDTFTCPGGKQLKWTHIRRLKQAHIDKVYAAKTTDCKVCPNRKSCFGPKQKFRILKVALFHESEKRNRDRASTEDYARIQRLRRIWCEGSFGVLKAQHNMAMTYKRGLVNIQEQCLLSASALNIKRMVKALA